MANSQIETLKWRLSWLEQLCQPGPQVVLNGVAQPYPGPTPELVQERDQLRREVRIAELDTMIVGTEQWCGGPGLPVGASLPGSPVAVQLRAWHAERDRLADDCE